MRTSGWRLTGRSLLSPWGQHREFLRGVKLHPFFAIGGALWLIFAIVVGRFQIGCNGAQKGADRLKSVLDRLSLVSYPHATAHLFPGMTIYLKRTFSMGKERFIAFSVATSVAATQVRVTRTTGAANKITNMIHAAINATLPSVGQAAEVGKFSDQMRLNNEAGRRATAQSR